MKILHLYANHKWTGPAELALQQVLALNQLPGINAELALAAHHDPNRPHAIEARARELGVPLRGGLTLRRHFHARSHLKDARLLAAWLNTGAYDLLHCHQRGDHLTAALALTFGKCKVGLVRSYWENEVPMRGLRTRFMFKRTDLVIAAFESQARSLQNQLRLAPDRCVPHPPILGDFDRPHDPTMRRTALRKELKLPQDAFLVGLTARIQPRRRWDLCWDTMAELASRYPKAHLCILGRPDEGVFDELCHRPLARLGLTDRVHFLGYRSGADYFAALAAFDAFLFLVPGSDATCRALREAMATGLPVVTTDLGYLPEIVKDDVTGLVRTPQPAALAGALGQLYEHTELRARLGGAASQWVEKHGSVAESGQRLLGCYEQLMSPPPPMPDMP